MVRNTSLANSKFDYLPSIILVNEKGEVQKFQTPDGETNAMPTPRSLKDMERVVNVSVSPLESVSVQQPSVSVQQPSVSVQQPSVSVQQAPLEHID
jgi:hypothetical protein